MLIENFDMHNKKYFYGLDIIRGISALFIVLYHYTVRYNENPITATHSIDWPVTFPWGCAAVSTFFILSGFLGGKHICTDRKAVVPFLKSRFIRLFPSFFISVIFTSFITYFFLPQAFCGLKDILLNFTMVPALIGAKSVDGAYWTLQMEWTFYIVITILMFFSSNKVKNIILIFWVLVSLGCNLLYEVMPFSNIISTLVITKHSQEFIIGLVIYNIIFKKEYKISFLILLFCVLNQLICQDKQHIIFFAATVLLIFICTSTSMSPIFNKTLFKPIIWISSISYPLYLIHQMVGFSIMDLIVRSTGYAYWIIIFVPLFTVIIIAWLIHKYVEIPAINKFR